MCAIFLKVGPTCGILNERIQLARERNVYICLTPQNFATQRDVSSLSKALFVGVSGDGEIPILGDLC